MHNNNQKLILLVFFTVLYGTYATTFTIFNRNLNLAFYMLFLLLGLAYYLTGFLDFSRRTLLIQDLTYSFVINLFLGGINYIFTQSRRELTVFLLLYLISNLLKYILIHLNNSETRVLLVGSYEQADDIESTLNNTLGYQYVGQCKGEEVQNLKTIIMKKDIQQIIFSAKAVNKAEQAVLLELKLSGVKILTYWQFNEQNKGKIDVNHIDEEWLLYSSGFDILHDNFQKRVKVFVDLSASLTLLLLTLPAMIIAAICVKLESKGPILFKQTRVGLNGKDFTVYKFRSMHLHDEKDHSKYSQGKRDERITAFGRLLRKSRIDELPQIFNIIKGDMSFIGPRPEWDKLGRGYEGKLPHYKTRYLVKPGITGWAQVMYPYGANLEDTLKKLEYDLYYIKHQDFAFDVQIIFKTIKTVLFGKGK